MATIAEMAAQRDPLYAATKPRVVFRLARITDNKMAECERIGGHSVEAENHRNERDAWLLKLTIRALRNQGQAYYDAR